MYKNTYNKKDVYLKKLAEGGTKGVLLYKLLKKIGLPVSTYYSKNEYKEAYEKARAEYIDRINLEDVAKLETALMAESLGYETIEKTVITDMNGQIVSTKTVTKWNRSTPVLLMFNLVNKAPEKWQSINKEKQILETDRELIINFEKNTVKKA